MRHASITMSRPSCKFRFAPSPNGPLHRGHALSALLNAALAKRFGGEFFLRIEDIDIGRTRSEYISAIKDDMKWLGLDWQKPVRRQSDHMADYAQAFRALEAEGLVYPCFCSRRDVNEAISVRGDAHLWPRDPDGTPLYPGTCRSLSKQDIERRVAAGDIPQARLKIDEALKRTGRLEYSSFDPKTGAIRTVPCDASLWGDVVLVRKDTPTSYHLSVVVDDALQSITHVVRGIDLEAATSIHTLLQNLLRKPHPLYWHHDLILDEDGQKLAKSRQSLSLRDEIRGGLTRDVLISSFRRDPLVDQLLDL